jgi:hypothetical protein
MFRRTPEAHVEIVASAANFASSSKRACLKQFAKLVKLYNLCNHLWSPHMVGQIVTEPSPSPWSSKSQDNTGSELLVALDLATREPPSELDS